jgi:hypothetical protein
MWNYTVMAVLVVDSAEFPDVHDESYVNQGQRNVISLTPDDLDIYRKLY